MGQIHEYYLQPDAPDPILSEVEVLRCVRKFVPGVRAVTRVDESGGEARTYIIDDQLILKVQRPQQVRLSTSLAKEVFYLHQLADYDSTLPVPRVLGYARETNLLEYNLQTLMPGLAFVNAQLMPEQREEVIFSVGRLLRRIHAISQGPFYKSAHFPADYTIADFRIRLADYFEFIGKRLHANGRRWPLDLPLEFIADRTLAALPVTIDFVAVHANPGPPHTFIDPRSGTFVGLIDFGDSYISHPAMDLWRWQPPADRRQVFAGYTADAPVSNDFLQVWKCINILSDVVMIGNLSEHTPEAISDLQEILKIL